VDTSSLQTGINQTKNTEFLIEDQGDNKTDSQENLTSQEEGDEPTISFK